MAVAIGAVLHARTAGGGPEGPPYSRQGAEVDLLIVNARIVDGTGPL